MALLRSRYRQVPLALSAFAIFQLGLGLPAALAGDPFRTADARPIGDRTEKAFNTIFKIGNYTQAKADIEKAVEAEPKEPLAFAIAGSLAYSDENWPEVKASAEKTLAAAESLKASDPLRGNLYVAVGHFLNGAFKFQTESPLSAIGELPKVFDSLEAAEKISPQDPELNLVKGYLDLLMALNLPFAKPESAIEKFEKYAAPDYLVERALATAYRDLKQYDRALGYIERAIAATPDNPEVQYLKGQLLRNQGRVQKDMTLLKEAFNYYEKAIAKQDQLPKSVQISLNHEYRSVQGEIEKLAQNPNIEKL